LSAHAEERSEKPRGRDYSPAIPELAPQTMLVYQPTFDVPCFPERMLPVRALKFAFMRLLGMGCRQLLALWTPVRLQGH